MRKEGDDVGVGGSFGVEDYDLEEMRARMVLLRRDFLAYALGPVARVSRSATETQPTVWAHEKLNEIDAAFASLSELITKAAPSVGDKVLLRQIAWQVARAAQSLSDIGLEVKQPQMPIENPSPMQAMQGAANEVASAEQKPEKTAKPCLPETVCCRCGTPLLRTWDQKSTPGVRLNVRPYCGCVKESDPQDLLFVDLQLAFEDCEKSPPRLVVHEGGRLGDGKPRGALSRAR